MKSRVISNSSLDLLEKTRETAGLCWPMLSVLRSRQILLRAASQRVEEQLGAGGGNWAGVDLDVGEIPATATLELAIPAFPIVH